MCSSIFFLFSVVVYFALVRYKNVISILLVSDELDFSLYFVSWFENRFIWSFFSLPLKNHLKRRNKIEQNERKNYAFLEIMMNKFHVIRFPAESFELFLSLQPLIKLTGETRKQPIESWICRYVGNIFAKLDQQYIRVSGSWRIWGSRVLSLTSRLFATRNGIVKYIAEYAAKPNRRKEKNVRITMNAY